MIFLILKVKKMKRVALKIAYIGTNYYGSQRQPNLKTVEGDLIDALKKVDLIDDLKAAGYLIAGRTDKGVHALGNVVSFKTDKKVIINQINDSLPTDIRVLGKANVPAGFKPRFAQSRHYRYVIPNSLNLNLDIDSMSEASSIFQGTHNFQNFSKRSERNPIRTIDRVKVSKKDDFVIIDVIGESFLWNMVRKIARVLFMVGKDELDTGAVYKFFDPSTKIAVAPMPPEGLILMDVKYDGIEFEYDTYAKKKFLSILAEEHLYNKTIAAAEEVMIESLKEYY